MTKPLRKQALEYLQYLKEQGITHVPATVPRTRRAPAAANTKLEAAAGQWAQDHGYTIQAQQVRYPTVMWGSNRQESTGHGESPSETFTVILLAYGCDRP